MSLIEIENSRDGAGLLANGDPEHTGPEMEKIDHAWKALSSMPGTWEVLSIAASVIFSNSSFSFPS